MTTILSKCVRMSLVSHATVRHSRHASRDHLNVGGTVKRLLTLGLVGLFGVSALAACSSDKKSTVTEVKNANAAFCTDLTAYATAVNDLAALDPATATKADYTSAADAVKSSREALVAASQPRGPLRTRASHCPSNATENRGPRCPRPPARCRQVEQGGGRFTASGASENDAENASRRVRNRGLPRADLVAIHRSGSWQ
jgi:hypothetical protein